MPKRDALNRRVGDPERADSEQGAKATEVMVVVQDIQARSLGGNRDGQIRQWKAMGAVGSTLGKLAHSREDGSLHCAVNPNLAETFECPVNTSDPLGAGRLVGQLIADRPAPGDIATLNSGEQSLPCLGETTRKHPRRGIDEYRVPAIP